MEAHGTNEDKQSIRTDCSTSAFQVFMEESYDKRMKKNRQSLNQPVGILAVQIKHVDCVNLNPTNVFPNSEVNMYLRILVGKQIKCTCEYQGVASPTKVIMGDLRHFNVQLACKRNDPSNFMRIEVVAFVKEKPQEHLILATQEIHLYDVIKKCCIVDRLQMYRMDKVIAYVELELCFTYGVFGYGYANQFENRQKSAKEQLQHSMFWREPPPPNRVDGNNHVMLPRPVGYPGFIYFNKKVDIGDTVNTYKSDMNEFDWQKVEEPILLISRLRKRLRKRCVEYSEQRSRRSRIEYLRNMIQNHATQANIEESVIMVSDKFKLRQRQHTQRKRHVTRQNAEDKTAYASDDLETMARVMEIAPGIASRGRDRRRVTPIEDSDSEDSTKPSSNNIRMRDVENVPGMSGVVRRRSKYNESNDSGNLSDGKNDDKRVLDLMNSIEITQDSDSEDSTKPSSNNIPMRDMENVPGMSGVVRRRSKYKQVTPAVQTTSDCSTEDDETEAPPSRRQGDAVPEPRRQSLQLKDIYAIKMQPILELAATRFKAFIEQKTEMQHTFIIPKVIVTPSTPDISDDSENEDEDDESTV